MRTSDRNVCGHCRNDRTAARDSIGMRSSEAGDKTKEQERVDSMGVSSPILGGLEPLQKFFLFSYFKSKCVNFSS